MTPHLDYLVDYVEFENPKKIYIGDGRGLDALGQGTMPFSNENFVGELTKVLWIPELSENLLSIGQSIELGCNVQFNESRADFYRDGELVLSSSKGADDIYYTVELTPVVNRAVCESALLGATLEDWHKRLDHCSFDTVRALVKSDAVTGMTVANDTPRECLACIYGKLCRAHHPSRTTARASENAAILHLDTVGPVRTRSLGNARYFILAIEEFSGYKLYETLDAKSAAGDSVKKFVNQIELLSKRPVKAIVSDNGSEFTNASLNLWLRERGIIHYGDFHPGAERARRALQ